MMRERRRNEERKMALKIKFCDSLVYLFPSLSFGCMVFLSNNNIGDTKLTPNLLPTLSLCHHLHGLKLVLFL
jgi:hypothetical protein